MPPHDGECPVLCLTKIFLFAATTLFVLYLPLGDPEIVCDVKNMAPEEKGVATMCNLYDSMIYVSEKSLQVVDSLICSTINALYEGKLKAYSVLSQYDRNDYCRIGGCGNDGEEESNGKKRKLSCRCNTKCSRKNKS